MKKEINLDDTKIWIGDNPALSKKVQEKAFILGYTWNSDDLAKVKHTESQALYFYKDKTICQDKGEYFKKSEHSELKAEGVIKGKIKKITDNMIRYLAYGIGCDNKSDLLKTEKELKEKLKKVTTDSDWSGRIIGYKLTPIFESKSEVKVSKFKI